MNKEDILIYITKIGFTLRSEYSIPEDYIMTYDNNDYLFRLGTIHNYLYVREVLDNSMDIQSNSYTNWSMNLMIKSDDYDNTYNELRKVFKFKYRKLFIDELNGRDNKIV